MNRRIFIADDDKQLLLYYRFLFGQDEPENLLFNVETFTDGSPLTERFREETAAGRRIPLCILDMRMPIMDGLRTAQTIRQIDEEVIVIIITSYPDVDSESLQDQLVSDFYYMRKPVRGEELIAQVTSLLINWNHQQELKTAYTEVDRIRRQFQALLDYSPTLIYTRDTEGRYQVVNKRFTDVFQIPESSVITRTDDEIFPRAVARIRTPPLHRVLTDGEPVEYEERLVVGGENRTYLTLLYPILDERGRIREVGAMSRDVTASRRAEEALRDSRRKYLELFHGSRDAIFSLDPGGRIHSFNKTAEFISGYNSHEILGKHILEAGLFPESQAEMAFAEFEHVMRISQRPPFEVALRKKDGTQLAMEANARWIKRLDQVMGVHVSLRDISDRKEAEAALKERESRLQTIMETVQAGLIVVDPESGRIVDANPCAARMIGCPPEALIGRNGRLYGCPEGSDLQTTEDDFLLETDDHRQIHVRRSAAVAVIGDRRLVVLSLLDITDIKELMEKQEMGIDLAKRLLNTVNGRPVRRTRLADDSFLFADALSCPCYREGGDHYFIRDLPPGEGRKKTVISLKDQSGHEVSCLLRSIATDLIHHQVLETEPGLPVEISLERLNRRLCRSNMFNNDDFCTALAAEIDHETRSFRFVTAGHPPFIIVRDNRVFSVPEKGRNMPLGVIQDARFEAGELTLDIGDRLLFYTDGLTDAPRYRDQKPLEQERLAAIVEQVIQNRPAPLPATDLMRAVFTAVIGTDAKILDESSMNPTADDITLLCLEMEAPGPDFNDIFAPADFEEVCEMAQRILDTVIREAESHGFWLPERNLRGVISETLMNAWLHGNRETSGGTIVVRRSYRNDFQLEVLDEGMGFNYHRLPDPRRPEALLRSGGRGIFITKRLADDVQWRSGGRHIVVTFYKHPETATLPVQTPQGESYAGQRARQTEQLMDITAAKEKDRVVLTIRGEIDEQGAEQMKKHFQSLNLQNLSEIVLDFKEVDYICSSGIGKLLLFYKDVAVYGGRIEIRNTTDFIYNLFQELNLDTILTITKI
jgi:anti-anti-sigma factor